MTAENLTDVIKSLTPEEQESVRQFIEYLRKREASVRSSFLQAADQFISEHPDLLQRLSR